MTSLADLRTPGARAILERCARDTRRADVDSANTVVECDELDNHDSVTQARCVTIF